ncbi:MAG: hypothetical protein JNJ50_15770, partial [Acidobacteria bacterium]|nr:hypothetical protein [Acidobacteriota bacterium]
MSYKTFKALVLIAVFSLLVSSVSASVFGQGKKTAKKPVKKKVDPLPAPTVPPNRVDPLPLPPLGPPEKSEFEQVANKLVNTVITKCGDKTYLIVEKELYAYSEKVHNLYLVDGVSSYVSEDQPTR